MKKKRNTLRFEDFRAAAESDTRVRCSRCRKRIDMHSTRCEFCGIHFSGEAWEFSPSTKIARTRFRGLRYWLLLLVVVATIFALLASGFF